MGVVLYCVMWYGTGFIYYGCGVMWYGTGFICYGCDVVRYRVYMLLV